MNIFKSIKRYKSGEISKQEYIEEMYSAHCMMFDYAHLLEKTSISAITIRDKNVLFICNDNDSEIKLSFEKADKRAAPFEILNFNAYEAQESALIFELIGSLPEDCRIFDVGANIGWYSLCIAKRFRRASILSFEPIKTTFDCFKKNLELNPDITNILLHNFGFSNKNAKLEFYLDPKASVSASLANITQNEDVEKIICEVKRLDEFTDKNSIGIDFMKCDVEGAEFLVYQGGIETIKHSKPIIFTEMLRKWSAKFNYHPNQIIELFSELGYYCFTVREGKLHKFGLMNDLTVETNFFFLHKEKHCVQINRFSKTKLI
jgi:FkbM family methyltransferase